VSRAGFRVLLAQVALLTCYLAATRALAHGVDMQGVSVRLQGDKARLVATPEARAFDSIDDDGDGHVTASEVRAHRSEILSSVHRRVALTNEHGAKAVVYFEDVLVSDELSSSADGHLKLILRYRWPEAPATADLDYDLFAGEGDSIRLYTRDDETSRVTQASLTPGDHKVRLLGEVEERSPSAEAEREPLWVSGVKHVLEGWDHLLFILAMVVSTRSLRRLVAPLSAFTLSHTISLGAISLGLFPALSSALVELVISASIAVVALYGLWVRTPRYLWLLTGTLGFAHGLGMGQALSASLGSLDAWAGALLTMTIAIELTQLAVALVLLRVLALPFLERTWLTNLPAAYAALGSRWPEEHAPSAGLPRGPIAARRSPRPAVERAA
jgi:hydrogenase/urease accessory protein HupE